MSNSSHHSAQASLLPDGKRLHLHHGPIDLIVEAWGSPREVAKTYQQAQHAFRDVLSELVDELPLLRTPADQIHAEPNGAIARLMTGAAHAFVHPLISPRFVTPMAAVAGAVAEHVLACAISGRALSRAYVNNGGDIALHIASGAFRLAIVEDPVTVRRSGTISLSADDAVRGVATSGWRGRSQSFGIADAVTVLAATPAVADVAATVVANAVNLPGSPKIERLPANDIRPDSDLGARLVTVAVGGLTDGEISVALERGEDAAREMLAVGVIEAVFLCLQGSTRTVGHARDTTAYLTDHSVAGQIAGAQQSLHNEKRIQ